MLDVLVAVMLMVIIRMTRRSTRSSSPSASSMTHCSMSFWASSQLLGCIPSTRRSSHRLVWPFLAVLFHETETFLNDGLQMPRSPLDPTVNLGEKANCRSRPGASTSADRRKKERIRARFQDVGEEADDLATEEYIDGEPLVELDVVPIPAYRAKQRANSIYVGTREGHGTHKEGARRKAGYSCGTQLPSLWEAWEP